MTKKENQSSTAATAQQTAVPLHQK